jgi:hypothetical protein
MLVQDVAATETSTGWNRKHRNATKILLVINCCCLVAGNAHLAALISSALATISMKQGTAMSIKNLKWLVVSFISFLVSLISSVLLSSATLVDEEKAYHYKMQLHFAGLISQKVWGGVLGLILALAFFIERPRDDPYDVKHH